MPGRRIPAPHPTPRLGRLVAVLLLELALVTATTNAAAADEGHDEETDEAYVLVQQALSGLAHDTDADAIDAAMEKVDDALETDDQHGVDVDLLQQGMEALESGAVDEARTLLGDSIAEALDDQPLATSYETGTKLVPPELPGRGSLGAGDWLVLGLCIALAGVGVWLSVRFRPHESVSALRLLLGTNPPGGIRSQRDGGTEWRSR